jgi:hypothetical protein
MHLQLRHPEWMLPTAPECFLRTGREEGIQEKKRIQTSALICLSRSRAMFGDSCFLKAGKHRTAKRPPQNHSEGYDE